MFFYSIGFLCIFLSVSFIHCIAYDHMEQLRKNLIDWNVSLTLKKNVVEPCEIGSVPRMHFLRCAIVFLQTIAEIQSNQTNPCFCLSYLKAQSTSFSMTNYRRCFRLSRNMVFLLDIGQTRSLPAGILAGKCFQTPPPSHPTPTHPNP